MTPNARDRPTQHPRDDNAELDVLIVGAGPTGLTLAAQLRRFDIRCRIVDKSLDRSRESRALAVQARSLETLQALGLGEVLAARGRAGSTLALHLDRGAPVTVRLGDIGRADTRFPYILFVSQTETEAVLSEHLEGQGVLVERGVEFIGSSEGESQLECVLRHRDGREERVRVKYLVGCDGAHSTVRHQAGIGFIGDAYPQAFVLGDVELDGPLEPGAINAFASGRGMAMFFPLGHPATWRVIAMRPQDSRRAADDEVDRHELMTRDLSLRELQRIVDEPTRGRVRLRDPVWLTDFRLHHRQAAQYRRGRVFLAGDAAHIHSPVGAQGMNTGIQDASNLGWKIALVSQQRANAALLDSYHEERWPVGQSLLRSTDRLFSLFARSISGAPLVTQLRRVIVRGVVGPAFSSTRIRALVFHFVSQLGVRYRTSPVVTEGKPALRHGPRAGDRLPDARVGRQDSAGYLQEQLSGPQLHLLLCGPMADWSHRPVSDLADAFPGLLRIWYLRPDEEDSVSDPTHSGVIEAAGEALTRLGVDGAAQYLVRPDGHVGFRCAGTDLGAVTRYLHRWFNPQ